MQTHEADLIEIAAGRIRPGVVRPWRVAEFERHLVLVEAVRRKLVSDGPAAEFIAAHQRLAEAQRADPDRAFSILAAPQVGVWATRYLRAPNSTDSQYLQHVAAMLVRPPSTPVIRVSGNGLTLTLTVDCDDPYLDLFGVRETAPDLAAWKNVIDDAWQILTAHTRPTAAAMAETLRVLVPLRPTTRGGLRSATCGWAFGAIAMTLPVNALECAETLFHEFRHVVLGAIINHVPLVDSASTWTGSVPWRPDPRPAEGVLQGCFAYAGLIDLWRRLLSTPHRDRARSSLLTWAEPTRAVAADLAESGALTAPGEIFLAAMRRSL